MVLRAARVGRVGVVGAPVAKAAVVASAVGPGRSPVAKAAVVGAAVSPGPSPIAKAAVVQMTAALAIELARHGIRVNAIAPGYILTEMNDEFFASPDGEALKRQIPQRRIGEPSDLDGTLLLLASGRASGYMTGATIVVDGGHMLAMA